MEYSEIKEIQKQIDGSEIVRILSVDGWKYSLFLNGFELDIKKVI